MTIAKAFNEIAVAQGGTADTSGTIAGAIDAVNDALSGSDLPKKPRIEDGIRVLGEYIGGGGPVYGELTEISAMDPNNDYEQIECNYSLIQNGNIIFSVDVIGSVSIPANANMNVTVITGTPLTAQLSYGDEDDPTIVDLEIKTDGDGRSYVEFVVPNYTEDVIAVLFTFE